MDIKVPGLSNPVGLGSTVAKVTSAVGVSPCEGCKKRANLLDHAIRFVPAIDNDWTIPPRAPSGWKLETSFSRGNKQVLRFAHETGAYIVWEVIAKEYKNSYSFCKDCNAHDLSLAKWIELCELA